MIENGLIYPYTYLGGTYMGTWINVVLIILLIYFVVAKILAKNGFGRVVNVRGGMNVWNG